MTSKRPPATMHFRARLFAAEHGCLTVREIHRKTAEYGLALTESQLGKLLRQTPHHLNMALLAALCDIFGATANDLLVLHRDAKPAAKGRPKGSSIAPDIASACSTDRVPPPIEALPARRARRG